MNGMLTFLLAAAATAATPSIPDSLPAESAPHYRVIAPGIAAAGQPSLETLGRLDTLGFKTVINLRAADEDPIVGEEQKIVEGRGLRYVSVPVTTSTLSISVAETVRQVIEDPEARPVLLHCATSNRVGAVWGVIARERGRSLEEAEAEAVRAGVTNPKVLAAFREVAAAAPVDRNKKKD
jgi:uncharacterized protein (TIGR01244 family)